MKHVKTTGQKIGTLCILSPRSCNDVQMLVVLMLVTARLLGTFEPALFWGRARWILPKFHPGQVCQGNDEISLVMRFIEMFNQKWSWKFEMMIDRYCEFSPNKCVFLFQGSLQPASRTNPHSAFVFGNGSVQECDDQERDSWHFYLSTSVAHLMLSN